MDKAEMKRTYKQFKPPMGVYRIANQQNNTVFLGFATDLRARFNRHKSELRFGGHRNRELQDLWKALGESAFTFEILDELEHEDDSASNPKEELQVLADMWFQKLAEAGDSVVLLKNG